MEKLLEEIEAHISEVKGQIEEGGNASDAAFDLLDAVLRLTEILRK